MTDPDEYYPVNTIYLLSHALDIYFKVDGKYREGGVLELILPAGSHKVMMQTKGQHDLILWMSKKKVYVRARCGFDKDCAFNSKRISGADREALKTLPWDETNSRGFFSALRKWLMRLKFDYVTLVRSINAACDRRVQIPLTTKWGREFKKFDDYRRNKWPEDVTTEDRDRFLEEVLVRVSFWIQSAAQVDALK
jgi:hypothetical protein